MSASLRGLLDRAGQEIGRSSWITVDQTMIDAFADTTQDHQFIHVDPIAAAQSPFGGTIAHGMLTLSLLSAMSYEVIDVLSEGATGVNYGFDSVRFLSPVPSGSDLRGIFVLKEITETRPSTFRLTWDVTVELSGSDKPALVARWVNMMIEGSPE